MSKWDLVRWADIVNIKNGKNQKSVEAVNGDYPIYGSGGIMSYASDFLCNENTVVIGRKGSINKPIFVTEKFWNVDTAFGLVADEKCLLPKYLYYFCVDFNFEKLSTTVTIPSLTKANLLDIKIPLPPLEVQQKISETLNAASELLAMHKTQLAELDRLIQAEFYEMFGDPLANDKAWEKLTWNQVLFIKNGRNQKVVEDVNGIYPIYGSGGIMGFANNYICNENTVIIGRKGNINKPILVKEKFWNVDTAFGLEPDLNYINANYLFLFCKIFNFERLNKTVTIPSLTKSDLLRIVIPVPPILLQTQFAETVQKIEEQKALVQKSIDETQALFDSLMSEFFE